jgi:hypothetical protein
MNETAWVRDVAANRGLIAERLFPPKLRLLRFDDYEQTNALLSANSFASLTYEDWRGIWVDNPLWARMGKACPIGWVLETSVGETVGMLGSVLTLYKYRGDDLVSAGGRTWFVTAPYRGFALQLLAEYFSQPVDLFVNTTVSPDADALFSRLSARIPLGDWQASSYWVTSFRDFAEKALRQRAVPFAGSLAGSAGAALRLKDAVWNKRLARLPGAFEIESIDRFDSEFDVFWSELLRQEHERLLAQRDSKTLSWHFAIPMRRKRLWVLVARRNQQLMGYCALTQQDHSFGLPNGETKVLRGMRLADYQSIETEVDLLPGLLKAALERCSPERIDFLENLGRGVPKMHAFDECAPYSSKLDNWKFVYRAADPALEEKLRQAAIWNPSAFDGDASLE